MPLHSTIDSFSGQNNELLAIVVGFSERFGSQIPDGIAVVQWLAVVVGGTPEGTGEIGS